jgi:hypothetical protein
MILDYHLRFSNAQAVTADARSDNTIDLGVARKVFVGQALAILLIVTVAADFTTTDETYEFQLRTDDNTSFSSPTTLYTHAILASALTAGSKHVLNPGSLAAAERYLELYYNVGGTTPTMTLSAFLCPLEYIDMYTAYADAISIG